MHPPVRYLSGICTITLFFLILCPPIPAKEYQWQNYSEPLNEEIRVATGVDVIVNLPGSLLAQIKELKIVVEHLGVGNDGSGELRGFLSVNSQSLWKSYTFGNSKFTEEPITLTINAKDLKPGHNKLRFSSQRSGNTVRGWYTITAMRFDLPHTAKIDRPAASQPTASKTEAEDISTSNQPVVTGTRTTGISTTNTTDQTRAPSDTSAKKIAGFSTKDFGTYQALVIGNNDYQNITRLKTAVGDARSVAKLLEKKYNFNVSLLLNATRADIFRSVAQMRQKLKRTDNLLVYYAGHGNIDKETQRGYWLPINSDRSNKANWIANEDITSELKAIKAKHVLIIADSCYSGTLTRGPDVSTVRSGTAEEWVRRMAARQSRTVLTSGGLEPVLDAGGGQHSVFAEAFLRTLKDNDQIIDMDSLYERIRRRVVLNARQTPLYSDIRFAGHDDGDFVFVPR
ncbi:hypothetical protein D1BOALGB6SA_6491 [Olavius sp. associated proteobacterium Delta 1]|nr:hypothetical protein D1BOALGB6SA_6491 [Olavius sp. associated proteobacterium Delta 1]